jgi:hypothetical protein
MAHVHREFPRSAAMGFHHANDVAKELARLSLAEHMPQYLIDLSLERLGDSLGRLALEIEAMAMQGVRGEKPVSERAVWPKTSEERF